MRITNPKVPGLFQLGAISGCWVPSSSTVFASANYLSQSRERNFFEYFVFVSLNARKTGDETEFHGKACPYSLDGWRRLSDREFKS